VQRILDRQLRRAQLLTQGEEAVDLLERLERAQADPALPESLQRLCRGFGDFLARVENTYLQHDRDEELRIRSLRLSSEELLEANERLQRSAQAQAAIVLSLRATANELLRSEGRAEMGPEVDDLAGLSSLMSELLADRRKALGELEQQKMALDEHAIVTITDLAGVILYANDKFCEISGYPREELVGANHRLVKSGVHPPELYRAMWDDICAGKVWHGELCNRAKDGHLYWLAATLVPIKGESGQPVAYIAIRTDISERKQMEEDLRQSREQLRIALEASQMGFWDWNTTQDRTYFSDQWLAMLGYRPGELPDTSDVWSSLVHPDDLERAREIYHRHALGELPAYKVELRMRHRDGSWRWLFSSGQVTARDAQGAATRVMGIDTDISERKTAELALQVSKAQYDELTARIPVGVYTASIDPAGLLTFDYVSDRFCRLLALEQIEALGQSSWLFTRVHPDDRACLLEALARATQARGQFQWEGRFWVSGGLRWFRLEAAVAAIPSGGTRWNGILVDITDRKEAEQTMREARDLAVAASQSKSEFLANMSHEIRTPMNGVLGMLTLLLGTQLDDRQRHYADLARLSGQTLLSLINDILDLSKVEAGKLELEEEDFDLQVLLDEVGHMMTPRAQQKGLQFTQSLDAGTPRQLRGDFRRLRQVLVNLVGNALKFTETGSVTVRTQTLFLGPEEVTLRFAVRDTGIGIPRNKLGALFQTFSQVDASTTRRSGGTGLGLAISRQLADLLGGEIGVTSEEGQGSEFWFTALFARQAHPVEAGPTAQSALPGLDRDFLGARLLLAEDNLVNQELAVALLEQWNLRVDVVGNGMDAIQALRENDYQLVLMDIQMPKLDGLEATATLRNPRSGVRNPGIRVVALTAHAMAGDRQACLDAGMDDYLTKPLEPGVLLAILDRHLPSRQSQAPPPPRVPESSPRRPSASHRTVRPAVFKEEEFLQRLLGNRKAAAMILGRFREDCPRHLAQLKGDAEAGELRKAAAMVHLIKGSSATVGAAALQAQALELEVFAQAGDLEALQAGLPSLFREFEQFSLAAQGFIP